MSLYYKSHIFCCVNKRDASNPRGCCASKDAERLRNYMKDRCKALGIKNIRVNSAGCLDRCEFGPTMVIYPEGIWYHYDSVEDAEEIIQQHIIGGKTVERLLLPPADTAA
jgi:(2Fe-2S) ferredoxin